MYTIKYVTTLCYNFDVHEWTFDTFGRNITEKISNKKMLYFPTSLN